MTLQCYRFILWAPIQQTVSVIRTGRQRETYGKSCVSTLLEYRLHIPNQFNLFRYKQAQNTITKCNLRSEQHTATKFGNAVIEMNNG